MRMTVLAVCLVTLVALQGCASGSGDRVTYTTTGVAQRTFAKDFPTVAQAVQNALDGLGMPVREVRSLEERGQRVRAEMIATARDRRVTATVEWLTPTTTRVDVEVRKVLVQDRATATAILIATGEKLQAAP